MLKSVKTAIAGVIGRQRANALANPYHDWRLRQQSRRVLAELPKNGLRLHLGCGTNHLDGWVNIDGARKEGVDVLWDLRNGLPFEDNRATAIFGEHVLEHIPKEEAEALAREVRRVLEPGGVARFSVPDAERFLRSYAGDREFLNHPEFPQPVETALERVNIMMRQDGQHLWAYDGEALSLMLQKAGFTRAVVQPFGVSAHPNMQNIDAKQREFESLYVEGVK
jgi:predicted SAM-dependent methyltransferase